MVKNTPGNEGGLGLIPGSGRLPGEGNGNILQYSCLGNPLDRGACWSPDNSFAREANSGHRALSLQTDNCEFS